MALNLSQKQEVVAELADIAAKAHSLIAAEYAGITVSQLTAMRKQARETGVFLKVVKNTLALLKVLISLSLLTSWSVLCCMRFRWRSPALPVA